MATDVILILAHGIFGWGEDEQGRQPDLRKDYYFGVKRFLEAECRARWPNFALTTVAPTVPASDTVAARGKKLQKAVTEAWEGRPSGTRVHILAHSMGGLDSRWVIVQDGMADKIASLTTIATPHSGTTLGNVACRALPLLELIAWDLKNISSAVRSAFELAGLPLSLEFYYHLLSRIILDSNQDREKINNGLHALTLDGAKEFNREHEEEELAVRERRTTPVRYFAYGGRAQPGQLLALKPSYELIKEFGTPEERETGNDGAVSVWSAHYPWDDAGRDYVGTMPFDHFLQVNWRLPDPNPSETLPNDLQVFYREILNQIIQVQQGQ